MSDIKRLRHIVNENFNISNCFVKGQKRRNIWESFSTIGKPRKIHGFVYLLNCDCTYTLADGSEMTAHIGDVVYLPPHGEYDSHFFNFASYDRHGIDDILVDMDLSDENGNSFYLADNIKIFKQIDRKLVNDMFLDILNANDQPIKKMAEMKSIAYKMLSYFGSIDKNRRLKLSKYKTIANGINYLENDIKQNLSIDEIADMCNMSATYFRKLFKEYSGFSPVEFRIRKKIEVASEMLSNDNMSVLSISEYLGFNNVTYFSKLFKQYMGVSPHQYRIKSR